MNIQICVISCFDDIIDILSDSQWNAITCTLISDSRRIQQIFLHEKKTARDGRCVHNNSIMWLSASLSAENSQWIQRCPIGTDVIYQQGHIHVGISPCFSCKWTRHSQFSLICGQVQSGRIHNGSYWAEVMQTSTLII